jgi:hypothetical protein
VLTVPARLCRREAFFQVADNTSKFDQTTVESISCLIFDASFGVLTGKHLAGLRGGGGALDDYSSSGAEGQEHIGNIVAQGTAIAKGGRRG